MSILTGVTKGKIQQPFLGLVQGVDGVGKSSLGAQMPKPLFVGPESGTANLNVTRLNLTSFTSVMAVIKELTDDPHEYESLVVDSMDWLEPLVWEHVVFAANDKKIKSIEDFGYGKGYMFAIDEWRKMIAALTTLREKRKMNILLIAHTHVKVAKDPTVVAEYERYQLKLNDKAAALWREYVDVVLFANFETLTAADKKGKTRAFGDGARYLYTERRPGFDAKNRFGLPFQLALDWNELKAHIDAANPEDPEVIAHNIELLIQEVSNEPVKAKMVEALEKSKGDLLTLKRLENKIKTIVTAPAA